MKTMRVRDYNQTIAFTKWRKALDSWKERGYGYPAKTMFFFTLPDNETNRVKGWIAFDEHKSVFGMNEQKARAKFN